eukprot:gene33060-38327_t
MTSAALDGLMKVVAFGVAARCSVALIRRGRAVKPAVVHASGTRALSTVVADLRKEYTKQGLDENDPNVNAGPFALFSVWLKDACDAKVLEPNAMCLSTCLNNKPSSRYVLLKGFDKDGFVWFTNYESRKGDELAQNPNACLTFWWGDLERSVRIEGVVEKVSVEESTAYFHSRPRGSQLGAWSSNQSRVITDRAALEAQAQQVVQTYGQAETIPKPPHWGGFRLKPLRIEFWKGRESRLHDRLAFERPDTTTDGWQLARLQP